MSIRSFVVFLLFVVFLGIIYIASNTVDAPNSPNIPNTPDSSIQKPTTFEECVMEGNPIMESYPPQCISKAGDHFVQDVPPTHSPEPSVPDNSNGCFIGGCSSQICSDEPNAVSTCEWREAYACYKGAECKRQEDGKCGWTPSSELTACLNQSY